VGGVDSVRLELPPLPASVTAARHAVDELASQYDCDCGAARIAVSEAVGNCVLHAYVDREPGPIVVLAREIDGYLVITVADCGGGIRPRLDSPGLGIGLPIVGRIADDVRIESDDGGTAIAISFAVGSDSPAYPAAETTQIGDELERARELVRSTAPCS
jgi:serine/threonine-protein kinase RsbW